MINQPNDQLWKNLLEIHVQTSDILSHIFSRCLHNSKYNLNKIRIELIQEVNYSDLFQFKIFH